MPAPAPSPGPARVAELGPSTQRVSLGELLGGRYRVDQRIGVGGMAEVYRGHDTVLGRDVAIKLFRGDGELPEGSNGEQRRGAELQALAQLSHPNLITLYDGMVNPKAPGDRAYLVMELISGPNLAGRLSTGPLAEPEARSIGSQIADALAYVHAHGMVHRDVKPANILLGHDAASEDSPPRPRLSDFGIVRLLGSAHVTTADVLVGTASYLAPEQARGDEVGPAADVYALGLVLLEGLTGTKCFEGSALEVAMARLARSPEIPADLPAPWPALLAAMTAMDPEHRPSASEVAALLRGTADPGATTVLPAAVPADGRGGQATGMAGALAPAWLLQDSGAAAEDEHELAPPVRRAGHRAALVSAVIAAIAALGAGGYLLAQSPAKPQPTTPATTTTISHQAPAGPTTAPGQQAVTTSAPPATQAPRSTPTPSRSAPATSTAHKSSAPPSTSAAPSTSASTATSGTTTSSPTSSATSSTTATGAAASGASTATSSPAASPSAA